MRLYRSKTRAALKRVSDACRCVICGGSDWCSFNEFIAICMRVDDGSVKKSKDGGFVHIIKAGNYRPTTSITTTLIDRPTRSDLALLMRQYQTAIDPAKLDQFAAALGVTAESLRRLGIGRRVESSTWAFPMFNAEGVVVGIRLRTSNGKKFAVTGGREGIFLPADIGQQKDLLICEGPTDTAALLDLGFDAIGRPCCSGGIAIIKSWIAAHEYDRVIIVADADRPGQRGAADLAVHLAAIVSDVRIISPIPPLKDARDWKRAGATHDDILDQANAAEPVQVRIDCEVRR